MEKGLDELVLDRTRRPAGRELTSTLSWGQRDMTIGPSGSQVVRSAVTAIRVGLIKKKFKTLRLAWNGLAGTLEVGTKSLK